MKNSTDGVFQRIPRSLRRRNSRLQIRSHPRPGPVDFVKYPPIFASIDRPGARMRANFRFREFLRRRLLALPRFSQARRNPVSKHSAKKAKTSKTVDLPLPFGPSSTVIGVIFFSSKSRNARKFRTFKRSIRGGALVIIAMLFPGTFSYQPRFEAAIGPFRKAPR